jgi:hypothetical protein
MWSNSPSEPNYDPRLFAENMRIIEEVRSAVLGSGPADVRFDLLNEGAPPTDWPQRSQWTAYLRDLWSYYTRRYGSEDATISAIVDSGPDRLENLLAATDDLPPFPWFEVHAYGEAAIDIDRADRWLAERGYTQPMIVGETYYQDALNATELASRLPLSRELAGLFQWPLTREGACPSPPFDASEYTIIQ